MHPGTVTVCEQPGDRRRTVIIRARVFCTLACWSAIALTLIIPFVTQQAMMSWLSVEFLLVLAALGFSYAGTQLEKATPPLPFDDEDNAGSIEPDEVPPTRLGPATTGAIFGFIWGPPP